MTNNFISKVCFVRQNQMDHDKLMGKQDTGIVKVNDLKYNTGENLGWK